MVTPGSHKSLPSLVLLRNILSLIQVSNTRLSRSLATYSKVFFYSHQYYIGVLQPPGKTGVWALSVSLIAYSGDLGDLFSSGYLDISVPQLTPPINRSNAALTALGYPIRTPPDQSFVAAPRRLSRPCASFFGIHCQGIHCLHYE